MISVYKITLALNCLLIFIWASVPGSAQNLSNLDIPSYSVKNYTGENGLPQNSVKDIVADQDGFVWLTTESGLVRFDGRRFEVFNKGNLDVSTNRFTSFQTSLDQSDGQIFAVINHEEYISLNKGKAFVNKTYNTKLQQRIPELKKGVQLARSAISSVEFKSWIPPEYYIIPSVGKNGSYYLCSKEGISYFSSWVKKSENIESLSGFWHLFRQEGNLYALNLDGTFNFYDGPGAQTRKGLKMQGAILTNHLFDKSPEKIKIYWNPAADQVFLYLGQSLYIVDVISPDVLTTRLLINEFDADTYKISSIFYDQLHQRLFLGSPSQGLFVLTKFSFKTALINDKNHHNVFYAQVKLNNSLIFPQGYRLNFVKGSEEPIWTTVPFLRDQKLNNWSFLIDHRGYQWGIREEKLFRFSSDGKKILNKWFFNDYVAGVYQSDSNMIWVFTIKGNLFTVDPSEAKPVLKHFARVPDRPLILNQAKDTLWSGTQNGLYHTRISTKKTQIVEGTERFNIRSIYISGPGEIWFTTYEHGFFLYKNSELFSFPSDPNRFLDTLYFRG